MFVLKYKTRYKLLNAFIILFSNIPPIKTMVMLTNVLRALVKNLKEEIIYEFYVNKVSF